MSNPYAREPLTAVLGPEVLTIPWSPAGRWIDCATSSSGLLGLLTGLVSPATGGRLVQSVLDGSTHPEDASAAACCLLSDATGLTWWRAARLLSVSCQDAMAGQLTLAGLDPDRLTVAQWCAAVYVLLVRDRDAKERFKIDVALDDPPPGAETDVIMSDTEFDDMVAAARAMPGQQ